MSLLAPPWDALAEAVARAVAEDLPAGDPTGAAVGRREAAARVVARRAGTVAGLVAAQLVFDEVDMRLGTGPAKVLPACADGDRVEPGQALAHLSGPARTLLAAERTVLNLLTHLSGIATATAAVVAELEGTGTVVRDTRKTVPGLRQLQKYAVRCGGGQNHRMNLSDALLVKDNHVAALGGVAAAVMAAREVAASWPGGPLPVEVEVDDLEELDEALAAGASLVLVDNMALEATAEAVRRAHRAGALVEASGGIRPGQVRQVALTGVDFVAIGALTHSAPALDIGLDWDHGA